MFKITCYFNTYKLRGDKLEQRPIHVVDDTDETRAVRHRLAGVLQEMPDPRNAPRDVPETEPAP